MLIISIAGFAPAASSPVGRRGPITALAIAHGVVFFAWLLLVFVQSLLVAIHRVTWHRKLGFALMFLLAIMVPLGFRATIVMVQRGYDLSGDQQLELNPRAGFLDPVTGSVFNFGSLLIFTALVIAALCYRRYPAIHKRLMLFANLDLVLASITHLLGHIKMLTGPAVIGSLAVLVFAAAVRDYAVEKRIHALTAALSVFLLGSLPFLGAILGPSAAWHNLISWLVK